MNLEDQLRELFRDKEADVSAPASVPQAVQRRVLVMKFATAIGALAVVAAVAGAAFYIPSNFGRDSTRLPSAGEPTPSEPLTGTFIHDFGNDDVYPDGVWELTFEGASYTYSDGRVEIGSGRVRYADDRLLLDRDTSCGRLTAEYLISSTGNSTTFRVSPDGDRCTTRTAIFDGVTWERS